MDPKDKVILQKILDERTFQVLQRAANMLISNWDRSCIKETEWETAKATVIKESKIEALKTFLEELEREAYDR